MFVSLYKLLETFRALMKHPRQTIVADRFTICSNSFEQKNAVFCVQYPRQYNNVMTVPFSSERFVCASLPAGKPSEKLNKAKPNRPVINDQNATKSYNVLLQISLWLRFFVLCPSVWRLQRAWLIAWDTRLQQSYKKKKKEKKIGANCPLRQDSPSWFHWTGCKRSD